MLSRVAESLYWLSRYLERAEHTARLIDVHLNQMLDQAGGYENLRWQRLLRSLRTPLPSLEMDAYSTTRLLTFDEANNSSIVSCIAAARENARQVRERCIRGLRKSLYRRHSPRAYSRVPALKPGASAFYPLFVRHDASRAPGHLESHRHAQHRPRRASRRSPARRARLRPGRGNSQW